MLGTNHQLVIYRSDSLQLHHLTQGVGGKLIRLSPFNADTKLH